MKKFIVEATVSIEVEAETQDGASDIARDKFIDKYGLAFTLDMDILEPYVSREG
jgi:hypothetical protein